GPGGSTILVDTLTDNSNRSLAEIRSCFNKAHCNLGKAGCVSYQYDNTGILSFKGNEEEVLDILLMAEVDVLDVESDEEGYVNLYVASTDLFKAKDALEAE
ncbi:MAG: YebC/PmpR family DNA-binding transcriptional regulator, partial [Erysipelotrichaceae bacterium]|nr:YebC/PmpR family DNA-binding transcriptional regulator [Erysipelotrichaceae bacterium]